MINQLTRVTVYRLLTSTSPPDLGASFKGLAFQSSSSHKSATRTYFPPTPIWLLYNEGTLVLDTVTMRLWVSLQSDVFLALFDDVLKFHFLCDPEFYDAVKSLITL